MLWKKKTRQQNLEQFREILTSLRCCELPDDILYTVHEVLFGKIDNAVKPLACMGAVYLWNDVKDEDEVGVTAKDLDELGECIEYLNEIMESENLKSVNDLQRYYKRKKKDITSFIEHLSKLTPEQLEIEGKERRARLDRLRAGWKNEN